MEMELDFVQRQQHNYDENMNNIQEQDVDQEMTPIEIQQTEPHKIEAKTENPNQNSFILSPLILPPTVAPKTNKKKRRSTIVFDTELILPSKLMKRRISK